MKDLSWLGVDDRSAPDFEVPAGQAATIWRRHRRRRATQALVAASLAGLAVVAVPLSSQVRDRASDGLGQVAGAPSTAPATQSPTLAGPPVRPSLAPLPGAQPTPIPTVPVVGGTTSPVPSPASSTGPMSSSGTKPLRRSVVAYGGEPCRQSVDGWASTGWCWVTEPAQTLARTRPVTLELRLCRLPGTGAQRVTFRSPEATWSVHGGAGRVWSSTRHTTTRRQPQDIAAGQCLSIATTWAVTDDQGRRLPAGDYRFDIASGANITSATGRPFRTLANFRVTQPNQPDR